ncbi:hypothetical protein ACFL2X_05180 [Candidatus Latescibacterota bacterium]
MKRLSVSFVLLFILLNMIMNSNALSQNVSPSVIYRDGPLTGKMIDAEFLCGDSNYHAIIQASDGNVYYVICSHNTKSGAHMFRYNPRTDEIVILSDLTAEVGEDRKVTVNQGKVHSDIFEVDGKLYFGTHAGTYESGELDRYPGGHFMSYDIKSNTFTDYGIGPAEEGLVAMNMDTKRKRMYGITWPGYRFVYYDVTSDTFKEWHNSYGPVTMQGPRSIGIDPRTGNAYWPNLNGTIVCYDYETDKVSTLREPVFDADIIQIPHPDNVECVWRSIRWSDSLQKFYGVIYYSDWLFSYEPASGEIEYFDRIASAPNRKSGKVSYSTLAFELSDDGETVYYIVSNDAPKKDGTGADTELHLVTYNIPLRLYSDHGAIELDDGRKPRYCQGLEIGGDGNLYMVCWIPFHDVESLKGKKMLAIATGNKPELEIERSRNLQEINLIVIKDPYGENR